MLYHLNHPCHWDNHREPSPLTLIKLPQPLSLKRSHKTIWIKCINFSSFQKLLHTGRGAGNAPPSKVYQGDVRDPCNQVPPISSLNETSWDDMSRPQVEVTKLLTSIGLPLSLHSAASQGDKSSIHQALQSKINKTLNNYRCDGHVEKWNCRLFLIWLLHECSHWSCLSFHITTLI